VEDLSGVVALVTGGGRGLGAAIALDLARHGADVAFTYLQDSASAAGLQRRLQEMGRNGLALQADARDFARAHHVVEEVRGALGAPGVLVCSAGIARSAPLWQLKEADWDDVIDVSLKGSFNYIRAIAPDMITQKAGKIVCIGSINGLRGRMGSASYNAAKAGLVGLVKTAAAELGRHGINVNLVAPGFIETTTQVSTPEIVRDLVLKESALKRLGEPDDIAGPVTFLCSDAARHITGQVIKVDAGQYL
jgi:3-oxoacyl-[acyl-carrier protein] reductase